MPFGSGGPGFTGGKGNIDGPLTITGVISGSSPITSSGIQVVNHPGDGDTLTLTHNGTNARVISSTGNIQFNSPDAVATYQFSDNNQKVSITSNTSTNQSEFWMSAGGSANVVHTCDGAFDQFTVALRDNAGRQWVLTDYDNRDRDHDHPVQTHPTLFIHSSKNPNADNNQWVSLHHDGTGSFIESPTGHVNITGAAGPHLVVQATDGDHVALWHDGTNAYLTSSTGDIILKPAGSDVVIQNDSGQARLHVVPSAGQPAQITFGEASTSAHMFSIEAINSTEELLFVTNARTGRAIIITNAGSIGEDHDHGVQTDPTLYIHSVTDPGDDNTEWGSLSFSSANDEFNIDSAGKMQISTTGPELFLGNAVNAADVRIQGGTSAQQTSLGFYEGSTRHMVLGHKASIAQNAILVDDGGGNQLVFGNGSFIARDFDHAVQTDPTLFVHSVTDPDSNNTQFVSLHHDQTDTRIELGTGTLIVSGTHGDALRPENAAAGMEVHGTTGLLVNSATANAVGTGFDAAASQTMYVSKINGEIVTTILVDIDNLDSGGGMAEVIGEDGVANAYLTQITTAVNGLLYKAEMSCIEAPAGADCTLKINLLTSADGTLAGKADASGAGPQILIATSADWSAASSITTTGLVNSGDGSNTAGEFLYLATADAATAGGEYTAGKFIIKLYGASF